MQTQITLPFSAGSVIPGTAGKEYRVGSVIKTGGAGIIFEATDISRTPEVLRAAKIVHPQSFFAGDAEGHRLAVQGFNRESLALQKYNHPQIPEFIDRMTHDGVDVLITLKAAQARELLSAMGNPAEAHLESETTIRIRNARIEIGDMGVTVHHGGVTIDLAAGSFTLGRPPSRPRS